jgi:hypothetical protein
LTKVGEEEKEKEKDKLAASMPRHFPEEMAEAKIMEMTSKKMKTTSKKIKNEDDLNKK